MTMQHAKRGWTLGGLAIASMLTLGACADVDADALENDDFAGEESDELSQLLPPRTPDAGTTTPDSEPGETADLGKGNGQDVITIGDSWMDYILSGGGIQAALNAAGTKYRNYGLSATTMLGSFGAPGPIPGQFDTAVRRSPDIKTVIMTGGGNDVLITGPADCRRGGPQCQQRLKDIKDALVALWTKMGKAGVKDVVYIGYSEGAGNGAAPPEFANTMKNGTGEACLAMKELRCTPLETTPIVRNQYVDGIHPTAAANRRIADAVLKLMAEKGMRR